MDKKQKLKIKVLAEVLGQDRADKRTLTNMKEVLQVLGQDKSMKGTGLSGRQIIGRIKKSSSVLYNILDNLEGKKLVKAERVKSRGPLAKKRIFSLTRTGLLLSAALLEKDGYVSIAFTGYQPKDFDNPIVKLNAWLFEDLEEYLDKETQTRIGDIYSEALLKAFLRTQELEELFLTILEEMSPIKSEVRKKIKSEKLQKFIRNKMVEHIRNMPLEDQQIIFLHFKNSIEQRLLRHSKGSFLKSYVAKLQKAPKLLHIPCGKCKSISSVDFYDFIQGNFINCQKCKAYVLVSA